MMSAVVSLLKEALYGQAYGAELGTCLASVAIVYADCLDWRSDCFLFQSANAWRTDCIDNRLSSDVGQDKSIHGMRHDTVWLNAPHLKTITIEACLRGDLEHEMQKEVSFLDILPSNVCALPLLNVSNPEISCPRRRCKLLHILRCLSKIKNRSYSCQRYLTR
jgi:hypothetical protein